MNTPTTAPEPTDYHLAVTSIRALMKGLKSIARSRSLLAEVDAFLAESN